MLCFSDIPAYGQLMSALPVSYTVYNKSTFVQEFEAKMGASDAFMYSGNRIVCFSLLVPWWLKLLQVPVLSFFRASSEFFHPPHTPSLTTCSQWSLDLCHFLMWTSHVSETVKREVLPSLALISQLPFWLNQLLSVQQLTWMFLWHPRYIVDYFSGFLCCVVVIIRTTTG